MSGAAAAALIGSYDIIQVKTLTFLQAESVKTDVGNPNYASVNIGTAAEDRYIICAAAGIGNAPGSLGSPTIGGNAATIIGQQGNGNTTVGLFGLLVPSGTSAEIQWDWGVTKNKSFLATYLATGIPNLTPIDSAGSTANPLSITLDTVIGGFFIGIAGILAGSSFSSWTDTEDFDLASSARTASSGHKVGLTGTSETFGVTQGVNTSPAFFGASF